MNPCKNTKINNGEDDYGNYRKLGGEVESRNAEHRIGMTPEQRRAILLAETEDVAREDQIFLVENSGVSAMGSTVVKRKADIAVKLQGKDISPTQLKVVDAFTTDVNNIAIDVVDANGKQRNITLKQGQDNRAGVKHSVLKHYETASNSYSAEDILLIPQIIEQGERKQDGKKVSYKLGINGVTYSVTTELRRGSEEFTNFYTNRKPTRKSLLNTDEQHGTTSVSVSADKVSDNIGDVQEDAKYSLRSDVQEIINDYESGDNGYLTIDDVAERLDGVLISYDGNESTIELENILNDYRQAQVDAKNWGYRMDSGGESEFESALYGWLNATEGQPLFRDGSGALSDADLSYANDPFAKALGKSQRSKVKQAKFAERERKYMRNRVAELVEKLGIGERVELIEGGEFDNERKARAKGWYDAKSGKIVINLANHTSVADIERTLLHEAVSHHGLRELFGKQFDTFLDNVFRSASHNIRTQIVDLATRNGWDFRTATEEYLAQLAEDTNFEALENNWSFWSKIKQLFMDMLESIGWNYQGPTLTDNELRYLLWRSYENMVNPGRHRSILGMAEDVVKREKFGIGTYNTDENIESQVAEGEDVKYSLRDNQGNPIDEDGKLIVEQVSSIDEITDADFDSPTRSIQLPSIPPKVDEAIGANGKPIVIKKNVFEKNKKSHKDLTPKDSRAILLIHYTILIYMVKIKKIHAHIIGY